MSNKKYNVYLFSFALALLITVSSLFISSYGYGEGLFTNYFKEFEIFLYNFIPIFILIVIFSFLFKSLRLSFLLWSLALNIMAYINYIKIIYREEPFLARDVALINEAYTMSKQYDLNLNSPNFMVLLGVIVLTVVIFILLGRASFNYELRFRKATVFTLILILITNIFVFDFEKYHALGVGSKLNMWIEIESYQSKGFLYPFIYSIKSSKAYKYPEYNEKKAEELYNSYSYENISEDKKVNVVVIMLESYKDFYKFQNESFEFERNPYEYFQKLQGESIAGNLVVNSFGGGTFLTETNFLTGYKHNPPFNKETQSYVRYLNEQGYTCYGFHPNVGSFYNRNNIYPKLGFHGFYEYYNAFQNISGGLAMDNSFYPFLNEKFDEETAKGPYFSFGVTYQNHGPYSTNAGEGTYIKWKDHYEEKWYNYFNNYLRGIDEATQAMEILVEHLRSSDEPTVLVMFGDHCPSMGDNKVLFDMFNIEHSLDQSTGIRNMYETPYIIWANNAAKATLENDFVGVGRDLEPAFLMSEVFKYIGWKGNQYNQFLQDFTESVSILKETWFVIDEEATNAPSEEQEKKIEEFKNIEYYTSHMLD
ncbi:LTA synthase family protein [Anaerosphaera multitolerans]|uniref:LTA synthase family protein n=1 Tax=Anaerosphaera multitolerans TaxID=2487351 RepID=A0A437S8R4_9FIRM|nr:LTA synthase family protein [Anaerosphaera multitolerans]RVU55483.1 LTA synthase family protein [Anaerosphaera multitolerans]